MAYLLFQLFWDDEDSRGRDCRAGLVLQLLREGKERGGRAKASRRRSSPIARELHTVQNQDWTLDHNWAQIKRNLAQTEQNVSAGFVQRCELVNCDKTIC